MVLTDLNTFACFIGRGQRHCLALPMQMGVVRLPGRIQLSERGVGAWLEDTSVCVCVCVHIHTHIYIFIYIYIERERYATSA